MNKSLHPIRLAPARLGLGLLLCWFWALAQLAQAQQKLELSLAPMRVDLDHLKAGQNYTDAATISNASEESQHIVVWAADWTLDDQSLPVYGEAGTMPAYTCSGWTTVNPREFDLAAGKSQRVRYTLSVPAEAPEKGFHCALVFQTLARPGGRLPTNALRTQVRLVTTFYARVGSPPAPQPKIESFTLAPQEKTAPREGAADPVPSWTIGLTLSNPGETHCRARGTVKLLDPGGHIVQTFVQESSPLLPKTQRRFSWSFHATLSPGEYHLQADLDLGQTALQNIDKTVTISVPTD